MFDSEHYEVAVVLNGLATIEVELGRPVQAEPLYPSPALPLLTRSLGDQHPSVLTCSDNLAALLQPTAQPAPPPHEQAEPADT